MESKSFEPLPGNPDFVPQGPSNLLITISSRRRNNAKNQLRSVLLEMYELFGSDFVSEVTSECHQIYLEYCKLTKPAKRTKSSSK